MDYQHKGLDKYASESNCLQEGLRQPALYENMEVHPTKKVQMGAMDRERQALQKMSVAYGSHMAMRAVIERSIFASTQRLGGYGSNMLALNSHMGKYDELDVTDYLNDPYMQPDMDRSAPNNKLEKVYGI
eukprot:CAMPEP_0116871956 /NCGR_PEP_ID=MMETSP0463-20121206/2530_1 /TAXON_ID=181622 /ORGANISM="Strombidinopsis sp, Strain SopsisLIS2011" /LENGTH=129 /DNA_ID=CAMNT_0004511343 /DNA_START=36 /DNA_END=425 /DNA_ORIENTATION=+